MLAMLQPLIRLSKHGRSKIYMTQFRSPRAACHEPRANGGFTLIEILVVLAVVGIVLGLSLPFVLSTKFKTDINVTAEQLVATLKEAQSLAVAGEGDTPYGIYFDTSATPPKYTLYRGSSYVSRDVTYNVGGYGEVLAPKGVTLVFDWPAPNATGPAEITFARLTGKLFSSTVNRVITLTVADVGNKTVTVTPDGVIY